MVRGVYRTSSAKWFHPQDSVPKDSKPSSGGTMRSPLVAARDGFQAQLRFAASAAPLTLAFTVHDPQQQQQTSGSTVGDRFVTSHCSRPFAVPVGMRLGNPQFLGELFDHQCGRDHLLICLSALQDLMFSFTSPSCCAVPYHGPCMTYCVGATAFLVTDTALPYCSLYWEHVKC